MGSGVKRSVTGAFVGTGAQLDVRTAGFRPSRVQLFNQQGLALGNWQHTMLDAALQKQVTAGTISYVTVNGITPLSDGFRIGAETHLNVLGQTVHWVAFD